MALNAGTVLGRYRLVARLGTGGAGDVWSATHILTGRRLAIKRLRPMVHDPEFGDTRARFLREARTACAVKHPHVVEVYDVVDQASDAPFLVMELLEGETLAARLRRERVLTPEATARLLLPVISAVGTAHARGIVHRDLKPCNIFLAATNDGRSHVKVLDFGIAKWMAVRPEATVPRTATGSMLGTPSYMAPEQATGERDIDHRADIWALGVILYECLSGCRPIEGNNPTQVMLRLWHSGIVPIERVVPDLPERWATLIMRMLSREVAWRPADLREAYALLSAGCDLEDAPFGAPGSEVPSTHDFELDSEDSVQPSVRQTSEPPRTVSPPGSKARKRVSRWFVPVILPITLAITWLRHESITPSGAQPSGEVPAGAASTVVDETGSRPVPSGTAHQHHEAPAIEPRPPRTKTPEPNRPRSPRPRAQMPARRAPIRHAAAPARAAPSKAADFRERDGDTGLPSGAVCERSEDCRSRYCVALSCR